MASDRLAGKVCVITGAAGGIGAESARMFEEEGAIVVGVDLAEGAPGRMSIQADVTDEDAVIEMYDRTREAFGRIDVLFNNAGISPPDDVSVLDTSARGLAARAGREPEERVPLLQARHPAPARVGRRLGDQHRVVRRGDGRGDVADLLHGVEGRGAGAVARARRGVRPPGRARERALPRARSTRRSSRSCTRTTRSRRCGG